MILYIVRHAIAAAPEYGIADEDRDLTREGIEKMKQAAAGLRAADAVPDLILTSPLVRARHTAAILMSAFDDQPVLKETAALATSARRSDVYREILKYRKTGRVMIVGHQPLLGEIAGEIVNGSAARPFDFKKGGACAIEIERFEPTFQGSLLWLTTPAILRKISADDP
jgi:phosphohistidine phosphatase